ncbi:hypothetical protein NSB25_25875 [Acetatifactor muris]|uniref:Uncharacterized protein n=1 Tax=Acetatifactor muris TaxID=879566 RepID=A0A2K4ZP09_9FIRM|nr:hypothetical protein [Acetatifactor muris]MCR2050666.1 hypothetical protein [Acetatifactor muris]SOY32213.1 hypothetical protein AMURIS_04971 [Acetatifactor muris]
MEEKNITVKTVTTQDESCEKEIKSRPKKQKDEFCEKECKVLHYNKHTKTLDIMFDQCGIRIKNVEAFNGTHTTVKYKGEIGKTNFKVFL